VLDEGLFKYLIKPGGSSGIFRDRTPLENGYIPDKLIGRTKEIAELRSHLEVMKAGVNPMNLSVFGGAGFGKTVVTKYVLRQVAEEAVSAGVNVRTVYLNGSSERTFTTIMRGMIAQLERTMPRTGRSHGDETSRFLKIVDDLAAFVVVILDEVDKLPIAVCNRLLYILSRPAELMVTKSHICVIAISNSIKFATSLPAPTQSSFGRLKLFFTPYSGDEIYHILQDRVRLTMNPGVCPEEVVAICAKATATFSGDARTAVEMLRKAAEIAEKRGGSTITAQDVGRAEAEIEGDIITQSVRDLPAHYRFILYAIATWDDKPPTTGQIHTALDKFCHLAQLRPIGLPRTSQIISALTAQDFLTTHYVNVGRRGGNTRIIALSPHMDRAALRGMALAELKTG
jgi:cell division control protein 6